MNIVFKAYKIVFICRVSDMFLLWLLKPCFGQCNPTTIYIGLNVKVLLHLY